MGFIRDTTPRFGVMKVFWENDGVGGTPANADIGRGIRLIVPGVRGRTGVFIARAVR